MKSRPTQTKGMVKRKDRKWAYEKGYDESEPIEEFADNVPDDDLRLREIELEAWSTYTGGSTWETVIKTEMRRRLGFDDPCGSLYTDGNELLRDDYMILIREFRRGWEDRFRGKDKNF